MLLRLVLGSMMARALTIGMTVLAIALSVALFLGVEKVRTGARSSFGDTISGTDLIVGARSGSVQLLLYSVFRIGDATNNVSWESYQQIASRPEVDWIVPISLGDSHRQFRVMGTSRDFFTRYQYRRDQRLLFSQGRAFEDLYDAVIGADVAAQLGYSLDQRIVISHGIAAMSDHDEHPFRVSGILAKTGTPVDRTVMVSMEAIEAIHADWQEGAQVRRLRSPRDALRGNSLEPRATTAALVGVKSRLQIFGLQRWINEYRSEPLLAILPGVALTELWQIVGVAESALIGVSLMVIVTALLGMMATILSSLGERRRELAIWRAMGARPATIVGLLVLEAVLLALGGAVLGVALLYGLILVLRPWIDATFGIWLSVQAPGGYELVVLAGVIVTAALAGLIPAARAYRLSLADGMQVKI